ncbi:transcriptional regulator with XRE-family HTH domain [Herbihabitans rhizosphaerae]|uniref:Transcriptional regulator with XRE-family HTH domain n=1 Tax=Herbihabitans rhizosphaerae TaxID=1872711 RepID=A0A4Q7KUR1_9PSEU|nr:helix-turn-helix transcriptional regulator [Herbihabitans rhizosphaerae]RZS40739.1 transcriptional regulator with XRE-family HTH domain [Herbihabitans rhizosphaerae]
MSGDGPVPFRARRLGRKFREMREAAGFTLERAGKYFDMSGSALQRWETGETKPNVNVVRSMMDLYDCRPEGLLDEVRAVRNLKAGEGFDYADAEEEADLARELTLLHVPGLLQTEHYMRALFARVFPPWGMDKINRVTLSRLNRKDRLMSVERPLQAHVIMAESALHTPVGGREVMGAQLRLIAELAALPTVTVQVIPLARGAHGGMRAEFALLTFPYPDYPGMLFVPFVNGAKREDKEGALEGARLLFEHVSCEALAPNESVELIERLAGDLYGP